MKRLLKHLKKNWHKYVLEILVVVVGILIAFSLNNWNETNKIRKLEKATLFEISNALKLDLSHLKQWINIKQLQDSNVIAVLNYLGDSKSNNEDINKSWQSGFLRPLYTFSTSPYDLLKSRGFDIVRDNKIRIDIQMYYDISIPNLIDYLNRDYELMSDFRKKYVSYLYKLPNGGFVPSNVDALRKDEMLNGLSVVLLWHRKEKEQFSALKELATHAYVTVLSSTSIRP